METIPRLNTTVNTEITVERIPLTAEKVREQLSAQLTPEQLQHFQEEGMKMAKETINDFESDLEQMRENVIEDTTIKTLNIARVTLTKVFSMFDFQGEEAHAVFSEFMAQLGRMELKAEMNGAI